MKLKIKKGLDLRIAGGVTDTAPVDVQSRLCAVTPDDFHGFVPKVAVAAGDAVRQGDPLLYNKVDERVKLVAPVGGVVVEVVRGERRKIERVVVELRDEAERLRVSLDPKAAREDILDILGSTGMLARMRQRPYDIVPDSRVAPRDIFVTAMDTAPLALNPAHVVAGGKAQLEAGVAVLKALTDGKVYLCHDEAWTLGAIAGAEDVEVSGPHPAGNAGVQVANIAPVNKGDTVWTLGVDTLYKIGRLVTDGVVDTTAIVAVTGPEVEHPRVVRTVEGAAVEAILGGELRATVEHKRIISGNVLTGTKVGVDGFLRFPYRQLTVIAEGDDRHEFMGWASLSPSKMSVSPTFPGRLLGRVFSPDARIQGGRRAMIMSGEYDRVLPMDILSEYLLKAIMSGNIDDMEKLGIYEIAPEDMALAEYVDTSKLPLQQIVRHGLDNLRKELE